MTHRVKIEEEAFTDIQEICDYIDNRDGFKRADKVANKIFEVVESLSAMPERGHHVPEIRDYGVKDVKEISSSPYRVIYILEKKNVYVVMVIDGRRDFRTLLFSRLLSR